jgi:choline dehydrogenase-like flavoprotein
VKYGRYNNIARDFSDRHIDASLLQSSESFHADYVIVGSGAGGATAAKSLSEKGYSVLIIEAGGLNESENFRLQEKQAYPEFYQDIASRKTADKAIKILQGKTVGGSTTVNWTSCFRTPEPTLEYWKNELGVKGLEQEALKPYFEEAERELNVSEWMVPANPNNEVLKKGCENLGYHFDVIKRNVKSCANLGYCGMGCPLNAKQSMLVTYIPQSLVNGARLISRLKVKQIQFKGSRVAALSCVSIDATGKETTTLHKVTAKQFILSGGAINTPGLLLQSKASNPYKQTGLRTFLHVSAGSSALFEHEIRSDAGAPQSVFSNEFLYPKDGGMGFKLEVPPIHPVLAATTMNQIGTMHADFMSQLPYAQAMIALLRDGFHEYSQGGQVKLDKYGEPVLDYQLTDYVWKGVESAYIAMAEIQFAAGAKKVLPIHADTKACSTFSEAKAFIRSLSMQPNSATLFSAHVMGGCALGNDYKTSVVDLSGRHHQYENLYIFDASIFPTSIGANPQLSIYGIIKKLVAALIAEDSKK